MNQKCKLCAHCVKVELLDLPDAGTVFHICDEPHVGSKPEGVKDDSAIEKSWSLCLGTYRVAPDEQ